MKIWPLCQLQRDLFHDDAVLTDADDAGQETTRQKSQQLIGFTGPEPGGENIRGPQIKTARNMFALPILQPESEAWFAQIWMIFWRPTTGRCRWQCH
ncbi:MAG: poly-beta-1,6-N-acetyl-D-glucosamine N-deacetylase PgaB [Enterobacter hormaechei]